MSKWTPDSNYNTFQRPGYSFAYLSAAIPGRRPRKSGVTAEVNEESTLLGAGLWAATPAFTQGTLARGVGTLGRAAAAKASQELTLMLPEKQRRKLATCASKAATTSQVMSLVVTGSSDGLSSGEGIPLSTWWRRCSPAIASCFGWSTFTSTAWRQQPKWNMANRMVGTWWRVLSHWSFYRLCIDTISNPIAHIGCVDWTFWTHWTWNLQVASILVGHRRESLSRFSSADPVVTSLHPKSWRLGTSLTGTQCGGTPFFDWLKNSCHPIMMCIFYDILVYGLWDEDFKMI